MTREESRPKSANAAPAEHICALCARPYTDAASHVETDVHLEAMADTDVRDWLALPPTDPTAVAFAKQIARLEHFYDNYRDWVAAMGLPDTPETFLINRRIAWIWIKAQGVPDYEQRMRYARKVIELEQVKPT